MLALIVAASALVGILASLLLLHLGLFHMGIRYLVCFALAYLVFLALLRLWAARGMSDLDPGIDAPDLRGGGPGPFRGRDGDFGGGGASGSWGSGAEAPDVGTVSDPATPGVADALDLDEGWAFLLPLAIVLGGLLAAGYVISIAPILLAEVLLDVVVAAGVFRGARNFDPQYWVVGALRRTWVAALALAVLLGGLGWLLQLAAPHAHTIGAVLSEL